MWDEIQDMPGEIYDVDFSHEEFICISFGPSEDVERNGWWNRKERFSSQRAAERCGIEQMPIAGTFGYVVIRETEDSWEIVDEIGLAGASVEAKGFTYVVSPAPRLVLV
jgi:hypothetical protein